MLRKLFKWIFWNDFEGGFVNIDIKSVSTTYLAEDDANVRLEITMFDDAVVFDSSIAVTYAELEEIYAAARRRGNI